MKDRWNYQGLGQVQYGHVESYQMACEWLDQPGYTVEDWGCGCAFARRFFKQARYVGLDGSQNEFADRCHVDLQQLDSHPDGILLRHVLEHNEDWRKLLTNAVRCAGKRLAIVFFIPFGPETKVLSRSTDPRYPGVPDIQFSRQDIMDALRDVHLVREYPAATDTLLLCER